MLLPYSVVLGGEIFMFLVLLYSIVLDVHIIVLFHYNGGAA